MNGKRALRNIITNIMVQLSLAIAGLLIPRFIMHFYGSEMNGLVSSISQFITYAALIEMGIANSSVIALYKPLAEQNLDEISEIVSSSRKMYLTSAYVYSVIILLIAMIYPLLYEGKLEYAFVFELVLCIGAVNAIDYFILGKYKVLLIADQKYYILNITRTVATILMVIISVWLLLIGCSLIMVKFIAIVTHLFESLIISVYIKNKYKKVNFYCRKTRKISQRWNALVHQLCSTITYNTDLVVLTLCLPGHSLLEISVYSVYSMVLSLLTNFTGSFTTGINASFGNLMVRGEREKIKKIFNTYEFVFFIALFIIYSCFAVLILPFVACYTKGMKDVNYVRLEIGILFALNGLSAQIKEVAGVIINAAGKYKETQKYAIEEAVSNIVISLILVKFLGIVGVLIGTLISHVWMDYRFILYMGDNLIKGTRKQTIYRLLRNIVLYVGIILAEMSIIQTNISWLEWGALSLIIVLINSLIIIVINCIFEKKVVLGILKYGNEYLKNGKSNKEKYRS